MAKYDDASWHWGAADFPDDAPEENGATYIGMFMTLDHRARPIR